MNLLLLEEKLLDSRLSFDRQVSLSGSPGYDPKLTFDLKKDIEWFEEQKSFYEHDQPARKV